MTSDRIARWGTRRPRGRPTHLGRELPLASRRAAIRTLATVHSGEGWSLRQCADAFGQAGREMTKDKLFEELWGDLEPTFDADDNVLSRCIKQGHLPYNQLVNGLYLWMLTYYRDEFQRIEDEEKMRENEVAVSAISHLLANDAELNFKDARMFGGTYTLFRPSHVHPNNEIHRVKFIIGSEAHAPNGPSEFNCSYESRYEDHGRVRSTIATGKIIPHYNRLMAIMTTGSKGSFILMFDNIAGDHSGKQIDVMGGIMISAATGVSSAWPVYARRTDPSAFEFKTHTAEELPSLGRGPWDRLRRGNIYWADETFPGFGLADVRASKQP